MLVHHRQLRSTVLIDAHGRRNKGRNHGLNHQSSCFKFDVHSDYIVPWIHVPNFGSTGLLTLQYWLPEYLLFILQTIILQINWLTHIAMLTRWLSIFSRLFKNDAWKGTNKEELISVQFTKMFIGVLLTQSWKEF